MKHKFYPILATVILSVLFLFGCKKQEHAVSDETIATAKEYFEQSYGVLTKAANGNQWQKPMPGDFTPLWNNSRNARGVGISSVDVPIIGQYNYVAVRGQHAHHDGECSHKLTTVNVVQKLSVLEKGGNLRECYVMTIIPNADCDVTGALLENEFSAARGNDRFSGFVAYNRLDGTLSHVEKYKDGRLIKRTEAKTGNENEISDLADGVLLYSSNSKIIIGNGDEGFEIDGCAICGDRNCSSANNVNMHCDVCFKFIYECVCHGEKCRVCGNSLTDGKCNICGKGPNNTCSICGKSYFLCSGHNEPGPEQNPEIKYLHDDIITDIFSGLLNTTQIKAIQAGVAAVDNTQGFGYEYLHGIKVWNAALTNQEAKMKNSFVSDAEIYLRTGNYHSLGISLHSILDTYYPFQDRVNMLGYFSYDNKTAIVTKTAYLGGGRSGCINDIRGIINNVNALKTSSSSTWNASLGSIYDSWSNHRDFENN